MDIQIRTHEKATADALRELHDQGDASFLHVVVDNKTARCLERDDSARIIKVLEHERR